MANGNTTPVRAGQSQGAGDALALFLKVFSGEVLTAFEAATVMKDLHMIRTISSGKQAQFPVTGTATAQYHTPGENIADAGNSYLSSFKFAEKTISIDGQLISAAFSPNVDDLMNHYDHRSIIATELGRSLAYVFDKQVMYSLIAAARSSANITGATSSAGVALSGGSVIAGQAKTSATALIDAIFDAIEILDTKDVPSEDRYVVLRPQEYYLLINKTGEGTAIINRDFNDGNGSMAKGTVFEIGGARIVKSNHVPVGLNLLTSGPASTEDTLFGNAAVLNNVYGGSTGYAANHTNHVCTVFHKAAAGTVKLLDLAMESEYQIERQGTLMVAKMMCGSAPLRPECAVEIKIA